MATLDLLLPRPDQLECATSEGTDSKFAAGRFERLQILPAIARKHSVATTCAAHP